jgi:hypothetical protein
MRAVLRNICAGTRSDDGENRGNPLARYTERKIQLENGFDVYQFGISNPGMAQRCGLRHAVMTCGVRLQRCSDEYVSGRFGWATIADP